MIYSKDIIQIESTTEMLNQQQGNIPDISSNYPERFTNAVKDARVDLGLLKRLDETDVNLSLELRNTTIIKI